MICPLLMDTIIPDCRKEECAWWTPCKECAIVNIAHMIGSPNPECYRELLDKEFE